MINPNDLDFQPLTPKDPAYSASNMKSLAGSVFRGVHIPIDPHTQTKMDYAASKERFEQKMKELEKDNE